MMYLNLFLISCTLLAPLYLLGVVFCWGFVVTQRGSAFDKISACLLWPAFLGWVSWVVVKDSEVEGI